MTLGSTLPMSDVVALSGRERIWLGGNDLKSKRLFAAIAGESERPPHGPIDVALIAAIDSDEAIYFLAKLAARLAPQGRVWIALPDEADAESSLQLATDTAWRIVHRVRVKEQCQVYCVLRATQ